MAHSNIKLISIQSESDRNEIQLDFGGWADGPWAGKWQCRGCPPPSDRGRFLLGFARREELKLKSEVNESGVSCVSTSLHQFSDCFCVLEIEVMSARV